MAQEFEPNERNVLLIQEVMEILGVADCEEIPEEIIRLKRVAEQRDAPVHAEQNGADTFAKEVICPVCGRILSVFKGNLYPLHTPNHRKDEPYCKSSNLAILPHSNRSAGG